MTLGVIITGHTIFVSLRELFELSLIITCQLFILCKTKSLSKCLTIVSIVLATRRRKKSTVKKTLNTR